MTKSKLGKKGCISPYSSTSRSKTEGSHSKNSRQETRGRSRWRSAADWLSEPDFFGPHPTVSSTRPHQSSIINQENHPQASAAGAFSPLRFPLLKLLWCVLNWTGADEGASITDYIVTLTKIHYSLAVGNWESFQRSSVIPFSETGSQTHYVTKDDLKSLLILPLPFQHWSHKHASPCLVNQVRKSNPGPCTC